MRIGIDAREIVGKVTGVGQYLGGLLREWSASGATSRHEFLLYVHDAAPTAPASMTVRLLPGRSGWRWQQLTLPRAAANDHLDVFFAPQYTAPSVLNAPLVVAIHDVSFVAHPEWFGTREGLRLRWLSRHAARHARAVVTISDFSRREIVEHLNVPAAKIHVIPPGVPQRRASPLRGIGAIEPRLLYAGSIFNRRHVIDLIDAFAGVARIRPDASLDLVGDNRSYPFEDVEAAIARQNLGGRIRWQRYADDDTLADLYSRARAFAFFSEYEGLGLTPLEALQSGAPPVLYDTDVARESCGAAALYIPQGDRAAAIRTLERVLFDDSSRARLLAAAPSALAKYDWRRAARDTLSLLERC